jgi:hypothetical protein
VSEGACPQRFLNNEPDGVNEHPDRPGEKRLEAIQVAPSRGRKSGLAPLLGLPPCQGRTISRRSTAGRLSQSIVASRP